MIYDSDREKDEMGENYPFIDENKEEYTPEEAIEILTKARIYEETKKLIKKYGLEKTEDIIKEVYKNALTIQEKFLKMLYEIWKGL